LEFWSEGEKNMVCLKKTTGLLWATMGILALLVLQAMPVSASKTNPPGVKSGPGAGKSQRPKDWWKATTPYEQWRKSQLKERLEELKKYRSELMASGSDVDLVQEVNSEIKSVEATIKGSH
jgi:hypothetical protein